MPRYSNFTSTKLRLVERIAEVDKSALWGMFQWRRAESMWELDAILRVRFHDNETDAPMTVTVPAGFTTDLASVPAAARWFVSVTGLWNRAAVLHDWGYENGIPGASQKDVDQMFRDWMAELGVPAVKRVPMYLAVRAFGWTKWG